MLQRPYGIHIDIPLLGENARFSLHVSLDYWLNTSLRATETVAALSQHEA